MSRYFIELLLLCSGYSATHVVFLKLLLFYFLLANLDAIFTLGDSWHFTGMSLQRSLTCLIHYILLRYVDNFY